MNDELNGQSAKQKVTSGIANQDGDFTPTPLKPTGSDEGACVTPEGVTPKSVTPEGVTPEGSDAAAGNGKFFCGVGQLFSPASCGGKKCIQDAPRWLTALCALALVVMLNQVKVPLFGGRVAFADLAFVVAFVPVFFFYVYMKRSFFYPMCFVLVLLGIAIANLLSGSGFSGAVEGAQMVQQLLCGVLLLGFLVENAPGLCALSVGVAIVLNIAIGAVQARMFGVGSALAPADVLALKWGFGGAYTGLFRSRMALSFFLASGLAWLQPVLFGNGKCWGRAFSAFLLTVLCLLGIVHGQMFFIACLVLIPGAFVHSRRAGIVNLLAVVAALVLIGTLMPSSHGKTLLTTLNPMKTGDYPGELKTNHIDFAAALKMAARRPCTGVGSGRYQQCVGRCYGDMPNPSYNDIDTDTQASWGILAGTLGYPVAGLFLLLIASSAASGLRRYLSSGEKYYNTLALGGGLALFVFMLGMFVSDPLTRGLGWMMALALASICVPNPDEAISAIWRVTPASVIAVVVALGCLLGVSAAQKPVTDPLGPFASIQSGAPTDAPTADASAASGAVQASVSVFKIIDASEAVTITPPVEKGEDSLAATGKALKIPDKKGTPPDGKDPAMEYGGAIFKCELTAEAECKIWLRVWWDGSCGNTINLKVDDEPKSVTVGNDGTYRTWHWMEAPKSYKLSKGTHTITLLNREDGIMFDQMLITNDMQYVPQGIEEE